MSDNNGKEKSFEKQHDKYMPYYSNDNKKYWCDYRLRVTIWVSHTSEGKGVKSDVVGISRTLNAFPFVIIWE